MKNIANADLNLLLVFRALMIEQNTVKAGLRLGLSQPAVSHALRRLRETFADPLLVRSSRGLVPTPRALELKQPIQDLLERAEKILLNPAPFDPKKESRTFRIATTDYFELISYPQLLREMGKEAPNCTLVSRPTLGVLPKEDLESGLIDLAIAGFYGELPEGYYQQKLYNDDFACVVKKDHSTIKDRLTMKKYAEQKHIMISPLGDMKSRSAAILAKHGYQQKFVAGVSNFISPSWVVASSDVLLSCPRKLAEAFAEYLPVQVLNLPFEVSGITVMQVWHARNHTNPAHAWLRKKIATMYR